MKIFIKRILAYIIIISIFSIFFFVIKIDLEKTIIIQKVIESNKEKSICFWGDSKTLFNYNYKLIKDKFPAAKIYNYGISGASLVANLNIYGDNFCNCDINFVNIEEHTQINPNVGNVLEFIL